MIVFWIGLNIIALLIVIIWSLFQGYETKTALIGKTFSQIAFPFILINFNMYFLFLLIKKSKVRSTKIKLAKLSKQIMKFHIHIALTAALFIVLHGMMMIRTYDPLVLTGKLASGYTAFLIFLILLFSGILRKLKATGKRRRFHYITAFIFMGGLLFHIFI